MDHDCHWAHSCCCVCDTVHPQHSCIHVPQLILSDYTTKMVTPLTEGGMLQICLSGTWRAFFDYSFYCTMDGRSRAACRQLGYSGNIISECMSCYLHLKLVFTQYLLLYLNGKITSLPLQKMKRNEVFIGIRAHVYNSAAAVAVPAAAVPIPMV